MNKLLVILIGLVLLLSVGLVWTLLTRDPDPTKVPTGTSTPQITNTEDTEVLKISVATRSGGELVVKDFLKDPAVIPDPSNPGSYYLAGQFSTDLPSPSYSILYVGRDRSFTISLWDQPLATMRKQAEQEFMRIVGITEQDACSLKYSLLVPYDVAPDLASRNLGFSFCPGAVSLPE